MVLGFFLRTYYLNQNKITFGYDQARDAYVTSQIIQGDLKILGPPVSIGGFFHGVAYYYFIAIPYYISHGNPILPIIFLSLLSVAAIPLVYFTGKIIFKNKNIGLLSALFYTISFDIIQYSNWLSNPSLAVPFSVLLYCGLSLFFFTPKKTLGVILSAIGYGLSFQSQFFLGYLLIPIIFCKFFLKTKINKKQTLLFISLTGLILSTMILSYFKFGFTVINGIKTMASTNEPFSWQGIDFSIDFKMVLVRLVENFYRVVSPFNSFYTSIFVIFCFAFFIKQTKIKSALVKPLSFLWIFILSQALIIPFGGNSTPHINVGLQLPAILISAAFLIELNKTKKTLSAILIIVFCLFSLKADVQFNPKGQNIFAIQPELTLRNEMEVIEYTYKESFGQPFSINTITSPYWVNTLWSYIYQYHGQSKYGYLPSFHGRDQSGQLSYLPSVVNPETKLFYLIIEPSNGIPKYLIDDSTQYEDSFSKIVETKNFNGILVQKRELIKPLNKINFVK